MGWWTYLPGDPGPLVGRGPFRLRRDSWAAVGVVAGSRRRRLGVVLALRRWVAPHGRPLGGGRPRSVRLSPLLARRVGYAWMPVRSGYRWHCADNALSGLWRVMGGRPRMSLGGFGVCGGGHGVRWSSCRRGPGGCAPVESLWCDEGIGWAMVAVPARSLGDRVPCTGADVVCSAVWECGFRGLWKCGYVGIWECGCMGVCVAPAWIALGVGRVNPGHFLSIGARGETLHRPRLSRRGRIGALAEMRAIDGDFPVMTERGTSALSAGSARAFFRRGERGSAGPLQMF